VLPVPTPGLFPSWYQGGFVDIERLLMGFFGGLMPTVRSLTWFPPEKELIYEITEHGTIYLRVFRTGGHATRSEGGKGDVDNPTVQFAAMSASRDLSWEVIEFVRQVLYCYQDGGGRMTADGLYSHVTMLREISGPSLTPEAFRDQRLVPATFELETQRRKGLPSFSKYSRELIA
jgi:hypothetical protein